LAQFALFFEFAALCMGIGTERHESAISAAKNGTTWHLYV
jgi:hypothetical protein